MKRAYTLIELMIALAIGALLVGLAIPRFTAYQQRLEFEQQARIIQECMQGAAEQAAAPSGTTSGISKISVTLTSSSNSSNCVASPDKGPVQSGSTSSVSVCQVTTQQAGSQTAISGVSPIVYTLPLTKHGTVDTLSTSKTIMGSQLVAGKIVATLSDDCSNPQFTATITIPPSGLPVELNVLPS